MPGRRSSSTTSRGQPTSNDPHLRDRRSPSFPTAGSFVSVRDLLRSIQMGINLPNPLPTVGLKRLSPFRLFAGRSASNNEYRPDVPSGVLLREYLNGMMAASYRQQAVEAELCDEEQVSRIFKMVARDHAHAMERVRMEEIEAANEARLKIINWMDEVKTARRNY
ncbi:hypothetical protein JCM6882_003617 [Rhodosporidiobolus microsporus]